MVTKTPKKATKTSSAKTTSTAKATASKATATKATAAKATATAKATVPADYKAQVASFKEKVLNHLDRKSVV